MTAVGVVLLILAVLVEVRFRPFWMAWQLWRMRRAARRYWTMINDPDRHAYGWATDEHVAQAQHLDRHVQGFQP